MRPDRDARWERVLVAAQAGLIAVLAARGPRAPQQRARPPGPVRAAGRTALAIGGACAAAGALGLGDALTPSPRPRPGAALRTGGTYRYVRHPIYSGLLLAAAGRALSTGRRRHGCAAAGLAVVLVVKTGVEERYLRAAFPGYAEYAARTPRLLPRLAPAVVRRDR